MHLVYFQSGVSVSPDGITQINPRLWGNTTDVETVQNGRTYLVLVNDQFADVKKYWNETESTWIVSRGSMVVIGAAPLP